MILDKEVLASLGSKTINYYQNLGYILPTGKDKRGRKRFEKEKGILVKITDLAPTSSVLVNVKCEDCGKERKVQYGTLIGRKNSGYLKNGETLCSLCTNHRMIGINSGAYKHGNILYPQYRNNARRRGIYFNLTVREFELLIPSFCFYCGDKSNGIDRWESEIGYVLENCVPCCADCNFLKNNTNPDIFIKRIGNMYNTLKLKGLL